eukprot:TRINITY_DN2545_c2_g2_i1.p1 TRINITY_DN2545_c2_g2~~TRINITY_DN2545_c2_g2_i1.p1  ORF type:complete len:260 (+),score=43.90 TRINITY_DN2545_c2_g2_i1:120-899(+)
MSILITNESWRETEELGQKKIEQLLPTIQSQPSPSIFVITVYPPKFGLRWHFHINSEDDITSLGYSMERNESFYEAFYDTQSFELIKNNLWLRRRSMVDDDSREEWRLQGNAVAEVLGVAADFEKDNVDSINHFLNERLPRQYEDDETPTAYAPFCFAQFKTERYVYERTNSPAIFLDSIQLGKESFYWVATINLYSDGYVNTIPDDLSAIMNERTPVRSKLVKYLSHQDHPVLDYIDSNSDLYLDSTQKHHFSPSTKK